MYGYSFQESTPPSTVFSSHFAHLHNAQYVVHMLALARRQGGLSVSSDPHLVAAITIRPSTVNFEMIMEMRIEYNIFDFLQLHN